MTADSLLPAFGSRWAGRLSAPVRRSRRRLRVERRKIGSGGADPDGRTAEPWGDRMRQTTRIEQSGHVACNAVAEKRIDFAYYAASQWQTITRYADLAGTKLVAQSGYTFDAAGRLTALAHVFSSRAERRRSLRSMPSDLPVGGIAECRPGVGDRWSPPSLSGFSGLCSALRFRRKRPSRGGRPERRW